MRVVAQNDSDTQQNQVPEAQLPNLTDYNANQDIQRVEDRAIETIGLASDGRP